MENLSKYANIFDKEYPSYDDKRYMEISRLMKIYDYQETSELIFSKEFATFSKLVAPLVAIKNYKSQVPFPEQLPEIVKCIVAIRAADAKAGDPFTELGGAFLKLISLQGFQLPTISAVFHFCHPHVFPIVDVNVSAACALLKNCFPNCFMELEAPKLPWAYETAEKKLLKYRSFIKFIDQVLRLQTAYGGTPTYRFIDKALMVLGAPKLRRKVAP